MSAAVPAPGMDHDLYPFSPIIDRPPVVLPQGANLAFSVLLPVEHYELTPPEGSVSGPAMGGYGSLFPAPNLPLLTAREYGHRVGIFRMLDVLARHGVRASIAIDAMAAERYPFIVEACQQAGAEFLAHGISISRAITSKMTEEEEVAYIEESSRRLTTVLGAQPKGWMGPDQSESTRTPVLLDQAGYDYVCDWPNDEQPYRMNTPNGLMAVPNLWSLDDGYAMWGKSLPPARYGDWAIAAAETMAAEGEKSPRSLTLVMRPWLMGHAARIGAVDRILGAITGRGDVWATTTGRIADHWRTALG